jgi:hypothetical protein
MAHKNFFSFDKIRSVKIHIDSSAIETSARHILTSSTDVQIVIGKTLVLTMNLRNEPLHNGNSPAQW